MPRHSCIDADLSVRKLRRETEAFVSTLKSLTDEIQRARILQSIWSDCAKKEGIDANEVCHRYGFVPRPPRAFRRVQTASIVLPGTQESWTEVDIREPDSLFTADPPGASVGASEPSVCLKLSVKPPAVPPSTDHPSVPPSTDHPSVPPSTEPPAVPPSTEPTAVTKVNYEAPMGAVLDSLYNLQMACAAAAVGQSESLGSSCHEVNAIHPQKHIARYTVGEFNRQTSTPFYKSMAACFPNLDARKHVVCRSPARLPPPKAKDLPTRHTSGNSDEEFWSRVFRTSGEWKTLTLASPMPALPTIEALQTVDSEDATHEPVLS